jgi:HK97 family phage major capsid protein
MKRTAKAIKEERATKYDALDALNQKRKAEKRDFTEDEVTQFEGLETEISDLNAELRTVEAQERADAIQAARAAGSPVNRGFSETDEKDMRKYSLRKALVSLSSRTALDGIEKEMHEEGEKEMREAGLAGEGGLVIPNHMMIRMFSKRATATGGTNGDQGGLTIEELVQGYVETLRERSLALQLGAEFLTGLTANFSIPRENAVYVPAFNTENGDAVVSNLTWKEAAFAPKRATGFVDVSRQLLIQSAVGIEGRLRNQILQGHAELLDQVMFSGGGTNQPSGILADADVTGPAVGVNGGALTKALVDQLIQVIEEAKAWNDNTRFVTSPIGKKHMKNVKLDDGSGKFLWAEGNLVDGIQAFATTHVPKNLVKGSGENLTALIGGDFRALMGAQWGGTEIIVDPYTQAGKGMIRFVPAQYVDVHVIDPNKFKVIKDVNPA